MLNPGTVGKAAKQGEQAKVAPAHYEQDMTAVAWDRQETIRRIQEISQQEENRRQQKQMLEYDRRIQQQMQMGTPHIFGGPKNGGNF